MEFHRQNRGLSVAFLLAQLGSHASRLFAERLSVLHLVPAHAGILRRLANAPGLSQRELAAGLGMHASRMVAIIDEMESLGLLVRESSSEDRRTYSLRITEMGKERLAEISRISMQHNQAICTALSPQESEVLATLLQRIADQQGLQRGVHPGYRDLSGKGDTTACEGATAEEKPSPKAKKVANVS
ncbi:MAG TPA: MarR family transcriptional regulator [Acidobacteriaceae bacterium]|nr:MarR family transcriptional regulator [Acidobacteriaceae bacterium]